MKRQFGLISAVLMALLLVARGEGVDDKYVHVYFLIREADGLNENGQTRQAVVRYLEARTALKELQSLYPGWNDKVVNFRLGYIASKLEPLSAQIPATTPPILEATGEPASPALRTNQFKLLQDEIALLNGKNALLEAKLKEALSVQPAAVDPRDLAKAEGRIKELEKEKDLLKASLEQEQAKSAKLGDSTALQQERQILEEVRQNLARQIDLTAIREKENEALKKQIADLKPSAIPISADELNQQLQLAKATISELQSTNIALRTEHIVLESRISELAKEAQRDGGNKPPRITELEKQLETAQARLQAMEAKQVPYTAEELAMFKPPDLKVAVATPAPAVKRERKLPVGAAPLFEEAQRAIEAGRMDEAEKKILEVLRQDEKNPFILGNLAAVQIEQNRLPDAEQTLKKAIEAEPQDPANLYLMGRLKYLQEKYDEALDALSLSAKLLPDEARTQYFLGKALIHKGNRAQAETALRKAVQLKPGWGEAHYSLAVVYATQQPNFKELAQWHYQKAIAGGYPRNVEFEKLVEPPPTPSATP